MGKIPKIRFKGHSQEWTSYRLGDIGETYTGLSGKSKEDFGHGEGRYVTYMNVFTNPIASPEGIASIEVDVSQYAVRKGDILFTTSSETPDEVGMSSVWLYDMPHTYLNSFCFGFRPSIDINPYFSAFLMRSPRIRESFYLLAQGISRFNISKQKAMDIEFEMPSLDEQKKIGEFFKNLDDLINFRQSKLDKLRQMKVSLLSQMFPCGTEEYPRIRFKGFTEPWERKKIGDVTTMYSGGTPTTSVRAYYDGDIPFIRSGEIHDDRTELVISELGLQQSSAKMVDKGDILMAIYGATSGEIDISQIHGAINQAILCIKYDMDKYFFKCSWERNVKSVIDLYLQGAQGNLSAQLVKQVDMLFPSEEEQLKIGNFFHGIDESIKASIQEIKKLKTIKQSLLNGVFVP